MSSYQEKRQAKIERYKELAESARKKADEYMESSRKAVEGIPLGQPILVGHHSEKRHRRDLNTSWERMEKAAIEQKKAEYWEGRVKAAEKNHAIFSDDPDAIEKLVEKIGKLEMVQQKMKDSNKIVRSKKLSNQEKIEKLKKLGIPGPERLLVPDFCGEIGFAAYNLQNNNANIRRCKERLKELESKIELESEELEFGEIQVLKNVEDNRIQIFFPDKPDESTRKSLKSRGFRWSRYHECWQRHFNNGGVWATNHAIKEILDLKDNTEILNWQIETS